MLVFWLLPSRQWRELSQHSRGAISNNPWQDPALPTLDAFTLKLKRSAFADNGPRRHVFGKRLNTTWFGWVASSETPMDSRQSKISVRSSVGFRLRIFRCLLQQLVDRERGVNQRGHFLRLRPQNALLTTAFLSELLGSRGLEACWACHVRIHTGFPSASIISVKAHWPAQGLFAR